MLFRKISTKIRSTPTLLTRKALSIYRGLPISAIKKQKIKNIAFRTFGFGLQSWGPYIQWKAYQDIQTNWPTHEPAQPSLFIQPISSTNYIDVTQHPIADGIWEWADYLPVKTRISQIKASRLADACTVPRDMIDVTSESFESVAARVFLPALLDGPDISIILPVCNN